MKRSNIWDVKFILFQTCWLHGGYDSTVARRPIQLRKRWKEEGGLLQTVDENWKWVEWDNVRGQQSVYSRAVCCPTRSEYRKVQQQSSSSRVSAGCDKWPPARVATLVISEQARQAGCLLHKFSQQSNNSQTVELWDSFEREEKSAGDSWSREAAVELLLVVVVAGKRCGQEGS